MRWLGCAVVLGCSSPETPPPDAGADVTVDVGFPGPHPSVPQVQNHGGPVIAPNVVPVFFQGDAEQAALEDFMKQLAASSFWTMATKEYGAGPLTIGSSIVVTDTPPTMIDTTGIEAWLEGDAGWPAITQSTVFVVFFPVQTTVSDPVFGTSCTDFNGFHYEGASNTSLVYAVIPRCPSAGTLTGLDGLTATLSHELVETATDPLLVTSPGWAYTDDDHLIWSFTPGAEIADLCALEPQSVQKLVGSYYVQRPWSNAAALAGHDPCVPPLTQPYFNAAPQFTQTVNLAFNKHYVATKGVQIPVGMTRTIPVELFSDAPTPDWTVQAIDTTTPPGLTFSWDAQTGNNGTVLHLSITRTSMTSDEFVLESTSGTTTNLWFGFVAD